MSSTVIVYAKRTPIGKMLGAFKDTPAPKLSSQLIADALKTTKLNPQHVDEIIMGNVLTGGIGQAPARQAAIYGGLPTSACATTVNKVCGSGLKAVMLADQSIKLQESKIVFAGGQENMTLAPHLLVNSRNGYRFGNIEAKDHMQYDGLWDPYDQVAMGTCGDLCASTYHFTREEQDQFALSSYEKALNAAKNGLFEKEILPIEIQGKNQVDKIILDEEPSSVPLDKLPKLRPAFAKDGTVTAGNASSINDGAALLVTMEEQTAIANGLKPMAKIIGHGSFAHEPKWFTTAPIHAIQKVLKKCNLTINDIDLFEINEAFAVVPMVAMRELKIPAEKVNIHGGAVSLGHPIGASGARVLVTLIHALNTYGKKRGLAVLCIGGGEAAAMIVERC